MALLDYDVALEENFQRYAATLPRPLPDLIAGSDASARHLRQGGYTLFQSPDQPDDVTVIVETLALATTLNPTNFLPTASVNDLAMGKARAYACQYLYGEFHRLLRTPTLSADAQRYCLAEAQQLQLANLERLQLNFNQRERIADFLKDTKARSARLMGLSCYVAASAAGEDSAVTGLAREIGETLGVALTILRDAQETQTIADFHDRVLRGDYPLPLLFGFEKEADYFNDFFHQAHKPTADQFVTAQQLTLQAGYGPAVEMAQELLNQTGLDVKMLPQGPTHTALDRVLERLAEQVDQKLAEQDK